MDDPMICQCCRDGEVNEPATDYCHECGRHICDDCIAGQNDEHGVLACVDCIERVVATAEREEAAAAGGKK